MQGPSTEYPGDLHGGRDGNLSTVVGLRASAVKQDCSTGISLACPRGHPNAVRQSLTRRREQRDKPPPIPVELPSDPRVRDIAVRDHDLTGYDGLAGEPEEDSEE